MVTSQLFLTHLLTVILKLNLGIQVDESRQEEQIYRQLQCANAIMVTNFTAHLPVICFLA